MSGNLPANTFLAVPCAVLRCIAEAVCCSLHQIKVLLCDQDLIKEESGRRAGGQKPCAVCSEITTACSHPVLLISARQPQYKPLALFHQVGIGACMIEVSMDNVPTNHWQHRRGVVPTT